MTVIVDTTDKSPLLRQLEHLNTIYIPTLNIYSVMFRSLQFPELIIPVWGNDHVQLVLLLLQAVRHDNY